MDTSSPEYVKSLQDIIVERNKRIKELEEYVNTLENSVGQLQATARVSRIEIDNLCKMLDECRKHDISMQMQVLSYKDQFNTIKSGLDKVVSENKFMREILADRKEDSSE